ncbi:MAG: hypothetical protein Q9162_007293 [Coniocarpon cinnabarinum]
MQDRLHFLVHCWRQGPKEWLMPLSSYMIINLATIAEAKKRKPTKTASATGTKSCEENAVVPNIILQIVKKDTSQAASDLKNLLDICSAPRKYTNKLVRGQNSGQKRRLGPRADTDFTQSAQTCVPMLAAAATAKAYSRAPRNSNRFPEVQGPKRKDRRGAEGEDGSEKRSFEREHAIFGSRGPRKAQDRREYTENDVAHCEVGLDILLGMIKQTAEYVDCKAVNSVTSSDSEWRSK